jgi:transposase-like protein/IS1 family transposase
MVCGHCGGESLSKCGRDREGRRRFRCKACKRITLDKPADPLAGMKIDVDKAAFALKLLLEGCSIRSTERVTGLHRDTLCSLIVRVGENCRRFLRATVKAVEAKDIECDELWGFVGCKERTRQEKGHGFDHGDAYCFIAVERSTKLILAFHVGKRSLIDTYEFAADLRHAVAGETQISTDGFKPYRSAIPANFGSGTDFAQLVKKYGTSPDDKGPQRRYSPAQIIGIEKEAVTGDPDMGRLCTSHVERMNLSVRMGLRRMTRLTNGFSKKWQNHAAMFGLFFAWFNFCRRHQTLKTTPAVAHGIAAEPWTIERLLTEAAKAAG